MTDPQSMEELANLTMANVQYYGSGVDVVTVLPCAFCAHPGVIRAPILTTREALEQGGQCQKCGRGYRAEFTDRPDGSYSFEIVQTVGEDLPAWFQPPIRRTTAQ